MVCDYLFNHVDGDLRNICLFYSPKFTLKNQRVKIHPPNLGGGIFRNHLFHSVFEHSLPKFRGQNLPPPNFDGMGFQGKMAIVCGSMVF